MSGKSKGSPNNAAKLEGQTKELQKVKEQNQELNELCVSLEEEINYLKLREKKIVYLIHLLQNKGYPVQNIYEKELKNVNTMRIQEFIDQKEKEHYEQENGGPELDEKYYFSFHTDDSFEPICDGPMMKPIKPDCVPILNLDDLPEYETSSEEDDEDNGHTESRNESNMTMPYNVKERAEERDQEDESKMDDNFEDPDAAA